MLVLDPEPKDMYCCHPYHFMEICKPPVNKPIRSYQIHHLNSIWPLRIWADNMGFSDRSLSGKGVTAQTKNCIYRKKDWRGPGRPSFLRHYDDKHLKRHGFAGCDSSCNVLHPRLNSCQKTPGSLCRFSTQFNSVNINNSLSSLSTSESNFVSFNEVQF